MRIIYSGSTFIDGTGGDPVERSAFSVVDGRIESVGSIDSIRAGNDDREIDLDGKFVMPGMIDCHFHGVYEEVTCWEDYDLRRPIEESTLYHAKNSQTLLESGFTSAREVGSRGQVSVSTSKLIQKGVLTGPRLVPGGRILSSTGGLSDAYGHWVKNEYSLGDIVDGEWEVRKAVREQIKYGTKCIKVSASGAGISPFAGTHRLTMSEEEMSAAVYEARRNHVRVAAHAMTTDSIKNAVRAGVTTLEHGSFLDEEGVKLMRDFGTIFDPTLSVLYLYVHKGREVGFPDWVVDAMVKDLDSHIASFQMALDAKIPMVVGSDSGHAFNPQRGIALELETMVRYGMTPMDAIIAATRNGSVAAGLSKSLGTLQPGKLADFLVLDVNPIDDIASLQDRSNLNAVYQGGVKKAGYTYAGGADGSLRFITSALSSEKDDRMPLSNECLIPYEA